MFSSKKTKNREQLNGVSHRKTKDLEDCYCKALIYLELLKNRDEKSILNVKNLHVGTES